MEWMIVLAVLVAVPILFIGFLKLFARLGGWSNLADHFRAAEKPAGQMLYLRSMSIGKLHYNGCIIYCLTDVGLYVAIIFPFSMTHPPLLIPWNDFHNVAEKKFLWTTVVTAEVGSPVVARLRFPGWLAKHIEAG